MRDPVSGVLSATRFGDYSLDANGFLVTAFGTRVQGFEDSALTMIGDMKIDGTGWQRTNSLPPSVAEFQIQTDGRVVVDFSDGSSIVRGQILLQNFQNPAALPAQGRQCFGWSASAGAAPKKLPTICRHRERRNAFLYLTSFRDWLRCKALMAWYLRVFVGFPIIDAVWIQSAQWRS